MKINISSQRNQTILKLAVFAAAALTVSIAPADQDNDDRYHDHDRVILSFSTVGDSRQDPLAPDPTSLPISGQDAIWLQNTKALDRIRRSVELRRSSFLFFNGDMIMGYGNAIVPVTNNTVEGIVNSDLVQFYRQYAFWRGAIAGLMEGGTYVVPVPGNHETQWKAGGKKAQVANENAWRANMGDLILDHARFQTIFGEQQSFEDITNNPALDGLSSDQTQLSYSFDFRGSHFTIINTDPVGKDSHAPVNWLNADLAAAMTRGASHFFVFGHKPAFTYYYGATNPLPAKPSGLDNDIASRDAFWHVIEQYQATYFCGHEHIYHVEQPLAPQGGKAWQVLVGSGGSPFEATPTDVTLNPATDRAYAWATVKVYASGKVTINVFGFDDQFGPTRLLKSIMLR